MEEVVSVWRESVRNQKKDKMVTGDGAVKKAKMVTRDGAVKNDKMVTRDEAVKKDKMVTRAERRGGEALKKNKMAVRGGAVAKNGTTAISGANSIKITMKILRTFNLKH